MKEPCLIIIFFLFPLYFPKYLFTFGAITLNVTIMEKLFYLIEATYPCQKGDSGGVVYLEEDVKSAIVGVHSGGGNALSDTQYAMGYFVMARYVNNEFGIYLY